MVYPPYGAGYVSAIEEQSFTNRKEIYHVIKLLFEELSVFVPSKMLSSRNVRLALDLQGMKKQISNDVTFDFSTRPINKNIKHYENILLTGNIALTISVMTAILNKKISERLNQTEREFYTKLYGIVLSEIMVSERVKKRDAEKLLDGLLKEILLKD